MMTVADVTGLFRDPARLEDLFRRHGSTTVLAQLRHEGIAPYFAWRRPTVAELADERRRAALDAAVEHRELRRVCQALVERGITPVVFKGASWAFTDYPEPWCRPHLDIDILIAESQREQLFLLMGQLGYRRSRRIPGEFVNAQEVFERGVVPGLVTTFDVHWQVSNRLRMQRMLPAADLIARSVPAPFAGDGARRLRDDDGLLLGCLHPVAHHPNAVQFKWALDIALIVSRFDEAAADAFRSRVLDLGIADPVAAALREAAELVNEAGGVPAMLRPEFITTLAGTAGGTQAWAEHSRGQLEDAWQDIRALSTWRDRVSLMREHLFPPSSFVRATSTSRTAAWLPALYARRLVRGGWSWVSEWIRDRITRSAK